MEVDFLPRPGHLEVPKWLAGKDVPSGVPVVSFGLEQSEAPEGVPEGTLGGRDEASPSYPWWLFR